MFLAAATRVKWATNSGQTQPVLAASLLLFPVLPDFSARFSFFCLWSHLLDIGSDFSIAPTTMTRTAGRAVTQEELSLQQELDKLTNKALENVGSDDYQLCVLCQHSATLRVLSVREVRVTCIVVFARQDVVPLHQFFATGFL